MATPSPYYNPPYYHSQRQPSYHEPPPPQNPYASHRSRGYHSPSGSYSGQPQPNVARSPSQTRLGHSPGPSYANLNPFRGVLIRPGDPAAEAWAEYYAKGGTDTAGLVYFIPETVQGWLLGQQQPPPQQYVPPQQMQPQYQAPPGHQPRERVPSSSGGYQHHAFQAPQQYHPHHTHTQSLPASSYPYQQPPPQQYEPVRQQTLPAQPAPVPQGYGPPPHQPWPPITASPLPGGVPSPQHVHHGMPSRSPSRSPSMNGRPLSQSGPIPPPAFHTPPRPMSISQAPPPTSTAMSTSPALPSTSPLPSPYSAPQTSFPSFQPSSSTNSITSTASTNSTVSRSSSTDATSVTSTTRSRPLPVPAPQSPSSTTSIMSSRKPMTPQEAFAAVRARQEREALANSVSNLISKPTPTRSQTLPATSISGATPAPVVTVKASQEIQTDNTGPQPPRKPSVLSDLPSPGAKLPGGRPLPSPGVPPSPVDMAGPGMDKGKGKATEEDISRWVSEGTSPVEEETGVPSFGQVFESPTKKPSPLHDYEGHGFPHPMQPAQDEKTSHFKSEAQRRMQEKMEQFRSLRRRVTDAKAPSPTVQDFATPNSMSDAHIHQAPVLPPEEPAAEEVVVEEEEELSEPPTVQFESGGPFVREADSPEAPEPDAELELESSIQPEDYEQPTVEVEAQPESEPEPEPKAIRDASPEPKNPARLPALTSSRPMPPRTRKSSKEPINDSTSPLPVLPAQKAHEEATDPPTVESPTKMNRPPLPPVPSGGPGVRPLPVRSPSAFGRSPSAFGGGYQSTLVAQPTAPIAAKQPEPSNPSSPPLSPPPRFNPSVPVAIPRSSPSTPGLTEAETSSGRSPSDLETPTGDTTSESEEERRPRRALPQPPVLNAVRSSPETPRAPRVAATPITPVVSSTPPRSMALQMALRGDVDDNSEQQPTTPRRSTAHVPAATPQTTTQSTLVSLPTSSRPKLPSSVATGASSRPSGSTISSARHAASSSLGGRGREMINLDDRPPDSLRRTPSPARGGTTPTTKRFSTPAVKTDDYAIPTTNKSVPATNSRGRPPLPSIPPGATARPATTAPIPPITRAAPPPRSTTTAPRPVPGPSSSRTPAPTVTKAVVAPSVPVINLPDDEPPASHKKPAPTFSITGPPVISVVVADEPPASPTKPSNGWTSPPSKMNASSSYKYAGPAVGPSTHRKSSLRCAGCDGLIVGRIVSAMDRRWHPACFCCTECGENLEHVSSYEHGGKAYCHLDYHELFAPQCYHCKTSISEERFITVTDPGLDGGKTRHYHELHFFCAECGDPFLHPSASSAAPKVQKPPIYEDGANDLGYTVYRGHPYCEACHVRLRMPKCAGCSKSIRDEVVEALDKKWHFHCFVCTMCKSPFEDPSFFQRGDKAYCDRCYSILLRNEL